MAVKAECEAAGEKPKQKQHYTGNSDDTKQHHAEKCWELAATGQKLISSMLMKKKEPTPHITEESKMLPDIIEISDNSDSDEKDHDEIEASFK